MNSSFGPRLVNLSETAVAKQGNVFAVTERDGSLPLGGEHPFGIYLDDARHLGGHVLELAGAAPVLLALADGGPGATTHELTNPELDGLPVQTAGVRLERRLRSTGEVEERITVRAFGRPLDTQLTLRLEADFAPMLAVRGLISDGDAPVHLTPTPDGSGLRLARTGRDGVERSTAVTASPASAAIDGTELRWPVVLEAGEALTIELRYRLAPVTGADHGQGPGRGPTRPDPPQPATIAVDDALTQRLLDRATADLATLRSRIGDHHYFSAGVPWYATLFGRDSLITAHQMLAFSPRDAQETLEVLASRLGTRDDPEHEEDPGKVLHELRLGEVAGAGLTPLARYFGTVDATPLWLCLLCDLTAWTGDLALFRRLRPQVDAMLGWIDGPGDRDGDGLLDYAPRAPGGLRNQGWKDSQDGICDPDGRSLEPPVALVEPQGYAVRAKAGLAELFDRDGDPGRAARLRTESAELARRVDERFWLETERCFSMALGDGGRATRAVASNQGHLLWAQAIADPGRAAAIRDSVMGDAMSSGWGIRTLAAGQPAYNPVAYHLGSVWPHDTAMIAGGLRAYGFDDAFGRVFEGLLATASRSEAYRLPELFAGFGRDELPAPVPYPVSCQPQAWAAGALPYLTGVGLGLQPAGFENRLTITRPWLPDGVDRAELRGIRLAGSSLDLTFERAPGGDVTLADARVDGDAEVVAGA